MLESTNNEVVSTDKVYVRNGENRITEFVDEIKRQSNDARDYIVSGQSDDFNFTDGGFKLGGDVNEHFKTNGHCDSLIASKLGIPIKYFRKMRSISPELLEYNVNHWLSVSTDKHERPQRWQFRTLDGVGRAFLSDSYMPIDNLEMVSALSPMLISENLKIRESALTDRYMYIKALTDKHVRDIGTREVGDIVQAGCIIGNSEVGAGSYYVQGFFYRLSCKNGLITQVGMKRKHIGRKLDIDDTEVSRHYSNDTRQAEVESIILKARDTIKQILSPDNLDIQFNLFTGAKEKTFKQSPIKVITNVSRHFGLSESENDTIVEAFIDEPDKSQWGIVNAITRGAKRFNYDRQIDCEETATKLLAVSDKAWYNMKTIDPDKKKKRVSKIRGW